VAGCAAGAFAGAESPPVKPQPKTLLALIDEGRLTPRYWAVFGLVVTQLLFEVFDFFVVGAIVSAVAPGWKLSFGQTTVMLLSAGVGAMAGALALGWLSDRVGRKWVVVGCGVLCCLAAGSVVFLPDGAWLAFASLRFLVGFGYGGAGASQFALITEYTPAARRTLITSWLAVPAGAGVLVASAAFSALYPELGWRGVAALGFLPIVLALAIAFVAPESPRWLIARGRPDAARKAAASMLRLADAAVAAEAEPAVAPASSLADLMASPRRFWLVVLIQVGLGCTLTGVLLWGPTILSQVLGVSPQKAAAAFAWISLAGLFGRMVFALLPNRIGRVPCGLIIGYAGAAALALAALFHDAEAAGVPLFFVFLLIGQVFYDGAFSNVNTYSTELYPVRLGGIATGLSAASGGAGKILGPLALGLLAGASNLVSPRATQQAVLPGFLFLAACCLLVGLSYTFLGVETHGKPQNIS
jgi:putative MFS transporter